MRRPKPWRVSQTRRLIDHPFVRLTEDILVHPDDGRTFKYYYLEGGRHAVATVALTNQCKVVLTRQYRHPVGRVIYDLPAGRAKKGEPALEAARRELQEETGYYANHIEPLTFFNQFPGAVQTGGYIFFATDLQPGPQHLDRFEDLEVVELSIPNAIALVTENRTIDGSLMLGILFAHAKGLLKE
ncbi:MAG: NUDIX hydrolase [Anaerolineae bacterium]